jgi:hypothetical protein
MRKKTIHILVDSLEKVSGPKLTDLAGTHGETE